MNADLPWYRRTLRWGQTNLTEMDPDRYDDSWWREYWRRTGVQGIIVNAGGIVAYYPAGNNLQYRAERLRERDFFGQIVRSAHEEGVIVMARMDSNRAHQPLYDAHPDWFAVDADGEPYKASEDTYFTCISSPYYDEYIPDAMREIITRYSPAGFTDNSWSGLNRKTICYCEYCARRFHDAAGMDLPEAPDWDDEAYREWVRWGYRRRVDLWEMNNRVTREAGGPDCIWAGMIGGRPGKALRDYAALLERADICMLDYQCRGEKTGFQANADAGKLIHGLMGHDKLVPESMSMYQGWGPTFRVCSRPKTEAHMWMLEGFAGGIQPWWHHVSAYHEDRRQYETAEPVMSWHEQNEDYLVNREPMETVGIVWSQENWDFFGRDDAEDRCHLPYRGVLHALMRARIPCRPVHADRIAREADGLAALVLPNAAILSNAQQQAVRTFAEQGGGVLATGETSLRDADGYRTDEFGLADVLGVSAAGEPHECDQGNHTYMRCEVELRRGVAGPHIPAEPAPDGNRHSVLDGFKKTDILPFGGRLEAVEAANGTRVPLTFIPPFPIFPPETSYMRQERSDRPALVLNESGEGRVAYLAANIDWCYGAWRLPDHGDLLANLVRWTAAGDIPLSVEGPGLLDCHIYRQPGRVIVHVVNLAGAGAWSRPMEEVNPVESLRLHVRVPTDVTGRRAETLVSGEQLRTRAREGRVQIDLPAVREHEVVVIS